ncbi:MAG TPA: hypothetical protein VLT89_01115 [Usitatibacter sp.]|nr:hypothetical protein [Usitatibacter sp.]
MSAHEAVARLHASLSRAQRAEVCYAWDQRDDRRGLGVVRTFIANYWRVTRPPVRSDFFTREQQLLVHDVFKALIDPDWYPRVMRQVHQDTHGHDWGTDHAVALIENGETGALHFVFTGRHMTVRTQTGPVPSAAFGGAVMYGHQASGFYERPNHPDNVYWEMSLAMSELAATLDAQQVAAAVLDRLAPEAELSFGRAPAGLPAASLDAAQLALLERVFAGLLAPFRAEDRARAQECVRLNGGLARCHVQLARDGRMSAPHWDIWRIEGPAMTCQFHGFPHVHVWLHIADDPATPVLARTGRFLFPGHDELT